MEAKEPKVNWKWAKLNLKNLEEMAKPNKLGIVAVSLVVTGFGAQALSQLGITASVLWVLFVYLMGAFADAKPDKKVDEQIAWALLYSALTTGTAITLIKLAAILIG